MTSIDTPESAAEAGSMHGSQGQSATAAGLRQPDRDLRASSRSRARSFFTYSNVTSDPVQPPSSSALLALGTTFVIITGGIDLSIGTGMTLCAVMSGVFVVNIGPARAARRARRDPVRRLDRPDQRVQRRRSSSIPPFIATLAMMLVAQGLALVISAQRADLLHRRTRVHQASRPGNLIPGRRLPERRADPRSLAAVIAGVILGKTVLGRYTYSIGSNEEATAPVRASTSGAGRSPSMPWPACSPGSPA